MLNAAYQPPPTGLQPVTIRFPRLTARARFSLKFSSLPAKIHMADRAECNHRRHQACGSPETVCPDGLINRERACTNAAKNSVPHDTFAADNTFGCFDFPSNVLSLRFCIHKSVFISAQDLSIPLNVSAAVSRRQIA